MSASRPIRIPPENFQKRKLPIRRLRRTVFYRLHRASTTPILYGLSQNHRFSPANLPYRVLYAGKDFETCAMEVFGDILIDDNMDIALENWISKIFTRLHITAKVCDLTDKKTRMDCGIDLPAIHHPDLSIPKQWATAIAAHPACFDGILYPSRFTGNTCIALFSRGTSLGIQPSPAFPLSLETKEIAEFLNKYGIRLV